MTAFSSIRLRNWRQFADVSIDLHPRLTIITGANGAGKSTILNICSQHFGYSKQFLSTPKRRKGGGVAYDLGHHKARSNHDHDFSLSPWALVDDDDDDYHDEEEQSDLFVSDVGGSEEPMSDIPIADGTFVQIGQISYDNGVQAPLGFNEHQVQAYGISIINQQHVPGVLISSHRTVSAYQPVQGLSLQLVSLTTAYQAFWGEVTNRMNGAQSQFSPIYRMKESLIAMAAFGEGNQHLERNTELSAAFNGFVQVLRKVLPKELGFKKLLVRIPDIVLSTRSGDFILDASSGGVTALIEIAWQLYLFSLTNKQFVATLDEPENHLHPSMQRSILSNLIHAFPQAQFIVATHSPFIVSAVEASNVYALRYMGSVGQSGLPSRKPRRVRSIKLDQTTKAGSASEILREVLGVSVTIPEWAQDRLDAIIDDFEKVEVTSANLNNLRARLGEVGLTEFYPEALARVVGNR